MSTSGGYHDAYGVYHDACGGYHEYIGGITCVHQGDIISTSGDVQYIWVFNRT